MHTNRFEIVAKKCHELEHGELEEFMKIHAAYYSRTPQGFDGLHRENYRRMMEFQPTSVAYFVKINGASVAAALVLKKKHRSQQKAVADRWYSLAIDFRAARTAVENVGNRHRAIEEAMGRLADRIIRDHPGAWGTVSAHNHARISFFTGRHWKLATQENELLDRFKYVRLPSRFSFERGHGGRLVFSRSDSIHQRTALHGPEGHLIRRDPAKTIEAYKQVLLVPKRGK